MDLIKDTYIFVYFHFLEKFLMDIQTELIEERLRELRTSIPVFKGESTVWLANEIIKWEIKRAELLNKYP